MRRTDEGLVPETDGWFVLNACEARWFDDGPLGHFTPFAGDVRFERAGFSVAVLEPGQPNGLYHREDDQEDFLVISGECLLLVEGEERSLRTWDFVHCPPGTEHIFVGAGGGPCVLLLTGTRTPGAKIFYPRSELAARHGASADPETDDPDRAYEPFPEAKPTGYRKGWLPGA